MTTLYLGVVAAGTLLLFASVVRQLFFRRPAVALRGPKLSAESPDPEQLLRCNRDVGALLSRMSGTVGELLSAPVAGPDGDLGGRWERFSRGWQDDWYEVNERCRFAELSGGDLGTAYERMAEVHADLPAMRLKYQSLLVHFDEEQAAELAAMRRALDSSRAALLPAGTTLNPPSTTDTTTPP